MEQKNIVATIYLKNGQAVRGRNDFTPVNDVITLARFYNDSGIDKLDLRLSLTRMRSMRKIFMSLK